MKKLLLPAIIAGILGWSLSVNAQGTPRTDAIWARTVPPGTIKIDGHLNEPAWAKADSIHIYYGKSSGLPGSGWANENNSNAPTDPTRATVKFLFSGDTLFVGAWVPDSSIGGGLFNFFDGFLMNMRDVTNPLAPSSHEYFLGWVTEPWADTTTGKVGSPPKKIGGSAGDTTWGFGSYVLGTTNTDTAANGTFSPDTGYCIEMYFNLAARGYHVENGGVVLFNMAIYDADWEWPVQPTRISTNHAWIQGPWGNASWYDVLRIYTSPNVTISSGAEPPINPDLVIANGKNFGPPVIDGDLSDPVWPNVHGFVLEYGDSASGQIRQSYGPAGALLSGSMQYAINGKTATVLDPNVATIKTFFIGDTLYLSADVNDQVVTSVTNSQQWDGIRFTIDDHSRIDTASTYNQMRSWDITIRVDTSGKARLEGDAPYLASDSVKALRAALKLKPGTKVNDVNNVGTGYTVEAAVNLTKLGYPHGLDNGVLWLGVAMFDGDIYSDTTQNTGTVTWWYKRENNWDGSAGPAWCFMDPNTLVTGIRNGNQSSLPDQFVLLGNYPNPFNPTTTISYSLPVAARVYLSVFNVLGQQVQNIDLGVQSAGLRNYTFDASRLSSGVYFYRLRIETPSGKNISTAAGKMLLLK